MSTFATKTTDSKNVYSTVKMIIDNTSFSIFTQKKLYTHGKYSLFQLLGTL